ncbi:MAG: PEP-CTERM system TPR-repeat protein PrsT [Betaproteobacteria bacterium]|nr:PEP-CTERM system TPR-repeat protein PrsT [Betaproteobacteria bacterium]
MTMTESFSLHGRSMLRVVWTGAALALALAACGGPRGPDAALQAGRDAMARQDYSTAAIQLKNALQQGERTEVHELLAVALLELGQFTAAETHARRALASGGSQSRLLPVVATCLHVTGNSKRLVEEFGNATPEDPVSRAEFRAILAEAYLALGQPGEAQRVLEAAHRDQPGALRVRVMDARLLAATGKLPEAVAANEAILAGNAGYSPAVALQGDLLVLQGKLDAAKASFTDLIARQPRNAHARFALITLQMATNDLAAAATGIDAMKKALPGDIRGQYLEAVLAFRNGAPVRAQESIQQVLRIVPDHAPSMLLAGATAYTLGAFATAEDYLRRVIKQFPNSTYARNVLVATYLRKGQPGKAEDVLAPALQSAPNDPAVLRSAGEVAFANQQYSEAARYYERALALERDSVATRTRLAQIRLAGGESSRAIEELEQASGLDARQFQADLALIATLLNQRAYDKALKAADQLEKKQPDNPLTHTVRATILVAQHDPVKARASLDKALDLQFNYLPAVRILANLDLADRKPENARARYDSVLAREPNNDAALIAYADFLAGMAALPRDVLAPIERAIKVNPASVGARIALVKFHTRAKDARAALTAAQEAARAIPNDARVADTLGLAQMAAGEADKAIETYKRMVDAQPDAPLPLMRLASAQYAAKQVDAPIQALRKALSLKPDLLDAHRDIVAVQVAAGRIDDAIKESRSVQRLHPKSAAGFVLEGEVLAAQKKFADAATAYAEGMKRQSDPQLVVKQHQFLIAAGKTAEAGQLANRWLKEHPKDGVFRFYLANELAQGKDYAAAAIRFKELLAQQPDNLALLNNTAWVLAEARDPAALGFAERAFQQAPTMPEVLDTYGWLLVQSGEAKRGLDLLRQAAAQSPGSADIRLRLGKALIASGDKAAGRTELESALKGASGATKAEIEQLLRAP